MSKISKKDLQELLIANSLKTRGDMYSVKELANLTGHTCCVIAHMRKDLGLTRVQLERLRLDSKMIAEYAAAHLDLTIKQVGEYFECSASSISKFMRKHGVGKGKTSHTQLEIYKAAKVFVAVTRRNHEQNSVVVE